MEAIVWRVFIVSENALVANGLRHQLLQEFAGSYSVSCFYDFKSCLCALKDGCDLVIVDPEVDGKKGAEVLLSVKLICPDSKGLIYHEISQLLMDIESFMRPGCVNYSEGSLYTTRKSLDRP